MEDKISIEQAYNVCLNFFNPLWEIIESKISEMEAEVISAHELFFIHVCMGFESFAEWNEAVFRVTKMPKAEQRKGLKLSIEETFLCTVAFCDIYNFVLKGRLKFTLSFLKAMKENPEKYVQEWGLWNNAVITSARTYLLWAFDWNAQMPAE